MFVKMYKRLRYGEAPAFEKTEEPTRACARCNEFGGHFDGHDFQECGYCGGEGRVAR